MNLWTQLGGRHVALSTTPFPPQLAAHSAIPLQEPERGVIPVLHTLYDYDKGIS